MTAKKFTFKKEKRETGLAGVGNPNPDTQIKLDKKQVGIIVGPNWNTEDHKWRVRFAVKDENNFTWKTLKMRFDDEPSARIFVNQHIEALLNWNLHSFEDE